jgi:hypothetical protein
MDPPHTKAVQTYRSSLVSPLSRTELPDVLNGTLNGTGSCADTTAIATLARTASKANIVRCEGVEEFGHPYLPDKWAFYMEKKAKGAWASLCERLHKQNRTSIGYIAECLCGRASLYENFDWTGTYCTVPQKKVRPQASGRGCDASVDTHNKYIYRGILL